MAEVSASDVYQVFWTLSWLGALITVPSVLLQRAGRPIAAVGWILALFALPALALAAWWIFGRVHLRGRVRRRRGSSRSTSTSLSETRRDMLASTAADLQEQRPASMLAPNLPREMIDSVFPAAPGNRVALLTGVAEVQQAWLELVREAEHHLHLLFYVWRDDHVGRTLRDLLIEKARKGIQVRVLYDAVGSLGLPSGFFAELVRCGGQAARFMPVRLASATPTLNFRNHRKVVVADGRIAYTGGVNVGDEFMAWQDLGIIISGPGANQLQEAFIDDWYFTTGEELSSSRYFWDHPSPPHAKAMLFDDDAVLIGSANLDIRSFRLNFELSTLVRDTGLNRDLANWLDRLSANADEVVTDDFKQLPLTSQLVNAAAHLLSPLL